MRYSIKHVHYRIACYHTIICYAVVSCKTQYIFTNNCNNIYEKATLIHLVYSFMLRLIYVACCALKFKINHIYFDHIGITVCSAHNITNLRTLPVPDKLCSDEKLNLRFKFIKFMCTLKE